MLILGPYLLSIFSFRSWLPQSIAIGAGAAAVSELILSSAQSRADKSFPRFFIVTGIEYVGTSVCVRF